MVYRCVCLVQVARCVVLSGIQVYVSGTGSQVCCSEWYTGVCVWYRCDVLSPVLMCVCLIQVLRSLMSQVYSATAMLCMTTWLWS